MELDELNRIAQKLFSAGVQKIWNRIRQDDDAKDAYTRKRGSFAKGTKQDKLVFSDFEDLVETHQLKLIDTPFDIEGLKFVMPTGIHQATNGDNENCTLL